MLTQKVGGDNRAAAQSGPLPDPAEDGSGSPKVPASVLRTRPGYRPTVTIDIGIRSSTAALYPYRSAAPRRRLGSPRFGTMGASRSPDAATLAGDIRSAVGFVPVPMALSVEEDARWLGDVRPRSRSPTSRLDPPVHTFLDDRRIHRAATAERRGDKDPDPRDGCRARRWLGAGRRCRAIRRCFHLATYLPCRGGGVRSPSRHGLGSMLKSSWTN